jgi:hypothetical protein
MRDLNRVIDGFANWQCAAIQALSQRLTFEQLGDDVGCAVVLADVMNSKDVWMVQGRCRPRFLLEAVEPLRIG